MLDCTFGLGGRVTAGASCGGVPAWIDLEVIYIRRSISHTPLPILLRAGLISELEEIE